MSWDGSYFAFTLLVAGQTHKNVVSLYHIAEGEGQSLIAEALGSRTSTTVEAKTRLLPYVCVASGVSDTPWPQLWMQAREREGIAF